MPLARAHPSPPPAGADPGFLKSFAGTFRYGGRAIGLVWQTSRRLTFWLALLTVVAGLLPGAIAYVGKLLVDAVVAAADSGLAEDRRTALSYVVLEGVLIAGLLACQRGLSVCQSLLRAQLGHAVNVQILEKALEMSLPQFEDSEFYDRLTRARREASSRPLSLVNRTFGLIQNAVSLTAYDALLMAFSPLAVLVLVATGVPAFIAEAKFSGEAFRLFKWRAPETRTQAYLETLLAREDYAKEVQLFSLGPLFMGRYKQIFDDLYAEDRSLTLRKNAWGWGLGLAGTVALYGAFAWTVMETVAGRISLGEMTMYLLVFKQGQAAFSASLSAIGGMYEDNLYLSTLYEFLEQETEMPAGEAAEGPAPDDGLRFESVSFTYPGSEAPALTDVSFHVAPGQKLALVGANGSGKTTLIKLLTRLYVPDAGCIRLDGLDLQAWDPAALRRRIGVIFQDFARYQLKVGENVGAGDVAHFEDAGRWAVAAKKGMADGFIEGLDGGYETQLGRWFKSGVELSGGQWQRIALARAFMREDARILVLDEPTAAMDAVAEAEIFERFQALTGEQMAVLISHRFSTVRMADRIVVLDGGRIVEQGSHAELMATGGLYARLFKLQARGYR
jgi:ATP-binding cassette, subfamily B, bacterial